MMFTITRGHPIAKAAAGGLLVLSALSVSACGGDTTSPEVGTDVESVQGETEPDAVGYDGPYDTKFYESIDTYVDKTVTVSGHVDRQLSPNSFTIAGDDPTMKQLLVVSAGKVDQIAPNSAVKATGNVQEDFDIATVEEELDVDLDDDLFDDFDGEPYLKATKVDPSVPADK